jgi:hypothetical protein
MIYLWKAIGQQHRQVINQVFTPQGLRRSSAFGGIVRRLP